nr:hypothetical protein [Tanacetum cinerariifolium]
MPKYKVKEKERLGQVKKQGLSKKGGAGQSKNSGAGSSDQGGAGPSKNVIHIQATKVVQDNRVDLQADGVDLQANEQNKVDIQAKLHQKGRGKKGISEISVKELEQKPCDNC